MPAGPGDLERRDAEVLEEDVVAGNRELRPDEHHVHRQAAAALVDEETLRRGEHLRGRLSRRIGLAERVETRGVDADAVAHGVELLVALHGPSVVELEIPWHELHAIPHGGEVPHRHYIVEAVDTHSLAREAIDEPFSGKVYEHLVVDPAPSVLPDVTGLGREDDRRVAFDRQDDVGVAVDDLEAREVGHLPLETRVLGAADERGVEAVAAERLTDPRVAAVDVHLTHAAHERSSPLISAVTAMFSGVGTPCSRPKRTSPPLRKSISVCCLASTS